MKTGAVSVIRASCAAFLPKKFFGAFAINTEGELPGDGQTERVRRR